MEKSPMNLLQEIYCSDPWKMMVCCIFLNQTNRRQVEKVLDPFFGRWSKPEDIVDSDPQEIAEVIKPLGFYNRRSLSLIKFSKDWVEKEWKDPSELFGVGKYASDSWKIFIEGKNISDPSDHYLKDYLEWKNSTL